MTALIFHGHYDWRLVALSLTIAICAAYSALDLAGRTTAATGYLKTIWLLTGAVAMGVGIWAMHYVGMLAFALPVAVFYDIPTVGFSLLAAIASSAVALFVVSRKHLGVYEWLAGGLAMGAGICAMHYSGMAAMRLPAHSIYDSRLVGCSILVAFVVSLAALKIAFTLRDESGGNFPLKVSAATVMGLAIAAMHYTGMAAVCFQRDDMAMDLSHAVNVTSLGLGGIVLVTGLVLASTIIAGLADMRLKARQGASVKIAQAALETLVQKRTSELQSSELRWRGLIDAMPQFVWMTRPDGWCDYMSPQWTDYTGLAQHEVLGGGWLTSLHPADRQKVTAAWNEATSARVAYDVEYRIRSRQGTYRWFKARGSPLTGANGEIESWIGTTTDIDTQKRSEAILEAAVSERTAELAIALERAEHATRSKSDFLASMSHEIRTPMNGVIGMTELMLGTSLNSEQQVWMEAIRTSGEALLSVINDILDFSKLEAGKVELEERDVDLQTLVEETIQVVRHSAESKNVALSFAIDAAVSLDVIGDAGRLRQILLNLLANAVKFTIQGSVTLSVAKTAGQGLEESRTMLTFSVKDTGIGMTQKQQKDLFQAFTQGDGSTTRRFGGTGLGLAIARRLSEIMGGSIRVRSQPGEGSVFSFEVPLANQSGLIQGRGQLTGACLVELARADPLDATQIQYLERCGVRVSTAVNAEGLRSGTGIDANGKSLRPDILLIDASDEASLQGMQRVAGLDVSPATPIILVGRPEDIQSDEILKGLNIAAYLPKPIRRLPFLNCLQRALSGSASLHSAPKSVASQSVSRGRILVAEDNKVNQLVIQSLLKMLGYSAKVVENGTEACKEVLGGGYDLILMDCQMPVMDGFEATSSIRRAEAEGYRIPIVALSASVLMEERDRCYAAGMDAFLAKPVSHAELERVLEQWIPAARPAGTRSSDPGKSDRAAENAAVIQ